MSTVVKSPVVKCQRPTVFDMEAEASRVVFKIKNPETPQGDLYDTTLKFPPATARTLSKLFNHYADIVEGKQ